MKIKSPIIIVNFKTYKEATGKKAYILAKEIEKAAIEYNVCVAIAVQPTDLMLIAKSVQIPVFAQHADVFSFGAHTGKITLDAIKSAGACGTLINHSECNVSDKHIEEVVNSAKELDLDVVVCTPDTKKVAKFSKLNPRFIAVEPPELIGGTLSVTSANPQIISQTVKLAGSTEVLCGAGVSNKFDVKTSLKLGAEGVLVASSVVKHINPYEEVVELIKGLF